MKDAPTHCRPIASCSDGEGGDGASEEGVGVSV